MGDGMAGKCPAELGLKYVGRYQGAKHVFLPRQQDLLARTAHDPSAKKQHVIIAPKAEPLRTRLRLIIDSAQGT